MSAPGVARRSRIAAEVRSLERIDRGAGLMQPRIDFFPIVLEFGGIPDATEREFFLSLPATFALPAETIDRLSAIGGTSWRTSPQFQRFLRAVQATK